MTATLLLAVRDALESSPRVLLLGQRLLPNTAPALPTATPERSTGDNLYDWWLSDTAAPVEKRCSRADALGKALPLDQRLAAFRELPWRCVFTSAIDTATRRLLEFPGRRPVQSRFERRDPDARFLTLYRLFGSVERDSASEMPPPDQSALRQRRVIAQQILFSLPEVIGPNGHLFVEGWQPTLGDWLRPRDLSPSLFDLAPGQVLLFGIDLKGRQSLADDDDFGPLLETGIVTLFEPTLADVVESLATTHSFRLTDHRLEAPESVAIECLAATPDALRPPHGQQLATLVLDQQELRRLTETFDFIVPLNLSEPVNGSVADIGRAFRTFLQKSPISQLSRVRQFAFRRPIIDDDLLPLILKLINQPSPQDHTVVVSGQSGAGKTTLLSILAAALREAGLPVACVGQRTASPNLSHLDECIQRVESVSTVTTVVIWDGLEQPAEYQKLSQQLASLGRRALVVGSCYLIDAIHPKRRKTQRGGRAHTHLVQVPVEMKDHERDDLLAHFGRFLPRVTELLARYNLSKYSNIFAALFYLADPLRTRLSDGLIDEVEAAAERLDSHVNAYLKNKGADHSGMGAMEYALRRALGDRFDALVSEDLTISGEGDRSKIVRSEAMTLVNAVMLISRLGLETPQSLALRLLDREKHLAYRSAMEVFPVLTARTTEEGDILLSARQPLEAEIWCERRLPDDASRFKLIQRLATRLAAHEATNDRSTELNFLVRLLQAIGPQGAFRMPRQYKHIADVVDELRNKVPTVHPRLLLIEANALRESVQQTQRELSQSPSAMDSDTNSHGAISVTDYEESLLRAESSLSLAEDMVLGDAEVSLSAGARRMLSVLATERAAVVGARLWCLLATLRREQQPPTAMFTRIRDTMQDARRTWRRALAIEDDNFQALDTACWIFRDYLASGIATKDEECEILADWSDVVERYEQVDMTPDQMDKFDNRERELAARLGDPARFASVLERSAGRGGNAVHVLMARHLRETKGVGPAIRHLEENIAAGIFLDRLVLPFYYRLWWELHSGFRSFFPKDHMCLRLALEEWQKLDDLASAQLNLEGEAENRLSLFHRGWSALQLGRGSQASRIFEQLEALSIGSFRRGRTLALVSDETGKPRSFFGETRTTSYSHLGRVWLDELRLEIPFKTVDFKEIERRAGLVIGPFHIAINYRGAFAQPTFRAP